MRINDPEFKRTGREMMQKDKNELKNGKLKSEIKGINNRLRDIVRALGKFNNCCSIGEFGSTLLESLAKNMLAEGGSLYIVEEKRLVLNYSLDPGHAPDSIQLPLPENSAFGKALKTGQPQIFKNIKKSKSVSTSGYTGYGNETALIFPVTEDGKTIKGLLSLHTKNPPPFTKQDLEIGKIFMAQGCETLRTINTTRELSEKEKRFRAIFSSLQAGIIIINGKSGIITDVNNSAVSILGMGEDEIRGKQYESLYKSLCGEKGCYESAECSLKRPDGGNIEIVKSSSRFNSGDDEMLAVTFFDITDIVNTRNDLESKYNFYQSIIKTAHVIILLLDNSGVITFANPYLETLTGKSYKDYEGFSWVHSLVPEKERAQAGKLLENSLAGRCSSFRSSLYVDKKNSLIVMWFNSIIKNRKGETTGLLMIGQDMTQQIIIEERLREAEKMEALGQLSGGVAHDFNNQLAGILGYSEIIREEAGNNPQLAGYVDKIISSAKRASDMTAQLLAYSRKGKYQVTPVDIHKIIGDVSAIITRASEKRITIREELNAEDPYTAGDYTQLQNAVLNLAGNSIEAMKSGGEIAFTTDNIIISNETEEEKRMNCQSGLYVHLAVEDTGHGIDEETAKHIFEPFFTTKKTGRNTGLGLPSVYGTISNHKGYIDFKSSPGKGTIFNIYLPACSKK